MSTTTTVRRGTSNSNVRGNSQDRERRRAWLLEAYRADVDADECLSCGSTDLGRFVCNSCGSTQRGRRTLGEGVPACRCYRCGRLLTITTVTVDRIIPGCRGGTYRRSNIRPACAPCNSETGGRARS